MNSVRQEGQVQVSQEIQNQEREWMNNMKRLEIAYHQVSDEFAKDEVLIHQQITLQSAS